MTKRTDSASFFSAAFSEFGTIPRRGLLYLGLVALGSAASSLIYWPHRPHPSPVDYVLSAVILVGWLVAIYSVSMLMIGERWSARGLARFTGTLAVMVSPVLLLAFGVLMNPAVSEKGVLYGAVLALMLSLAAVVLLPGWPILQATSPRLVGPVLALKSTKGFRWSLFAASSVAGSLNRLVPDTSPGQDFFTVCALTAGSALVGVVSAMISLSVAVAAWRLMRSAPALSVP